MTTDDFSHVYHILQTENPVYFTALNLFNIRVGAVHTQLDLTAGEPTGEGETDHSLVALVRRAKAQPHASVTSTIFQ
jgi:hypothetical protein